MKESEQIALVSVVIAGLVGAAYVSKIKEEWDEKGVDLRISYTSDPLEESDEEFLVAYKKRQRPAIIFDYGGQAIPYLCGTDDNRLETQTAIERQVKEMYADLSFAERRRLSNEEKLDFTKLVIDTNSDKIITQQELASVDANRLKPQAKWVERYMSSQQQTSYRGSGRNSTRR